MKRLANLNVALPIILAIASWLPPLIHAQSACTSVSTEHAARPQPKELKDAKAHVYRTIDQATLRLFVFSPPALHPSDKRPAIVFYYGGGWDRGSVEQFVPQAKYLAQRGMVAIVADYRVRSRNCTTPFESVDDAREAIRWMRAHATDLGIDPARIVASGGSAGGHMALSTAVFSGPSNAIDAKPNALILFNPNIDVTVDPDAKGDFGADFASRIADISPFQHIHVGLPPTLILNGEADTGTPFSIAKEYCQRSAAAGNDCQLVGYEGANHGFFNAPEFLGRTLNGGDWYRQTLLEADRFLIRIGYLKGPSPTAIP